MTEDVAMGHLTVSSLFLLLGAPLTWLAMAAVSFIPLGGPLSYGRLRAVAMLVIMLGWLVPALAGAAYYMLPRLTGSSLAQTRLAWLGLVGTSALTFLGIVLLVLGGGDGVEPFGLPWWFDAAVVAVTAIPFLVTIATLRGRTETGIFASLWFILAAVTWLPGLALVSAVPNLSSLGRNLQATAFTAGFSTLWVTAMGFGVAYYVAVKQTDQPLANRQVAKAGFWSLAFAGVFLGPVQVAFGPAPDWLDSVAAVLILALPVAAIATSMSVSTTVDRAWVDKTDKPALLAVAFGLGTSVVVGTLSAFGAFSSAAALVSLTSFWDGVLFLTLFGVGGAFVAAFAYQAIPAMAGRTIDAARAARQIRFTAWGALATGGLLSIAGALSGFSWTGGAFSGAYVPVGDGWEQAMGLPNLVTGLAAIGALITVIGLAMLVRNVVTALTSGSVTVQEVLVYDAEGDDA